MSRGFARDRFEPDPREDYRDNLSTSFARGDPNAFDEVVRRFQPQIARLAYRLLGWRSRAEVEDVVQEVFLAALTHCRQLPWPVEPRNLADGDHAEQVPQPPATLAGRIEAVRSKSARGRVGRHRPTVARRARPGRDVSGRPSRRCSRCRIRTGKPSCSATSTSPPPKSRPSPAPPAAPVGAAAQGVRGWRTSFARWQTRSGHDTPH